ncbi:VC2046/SO_2500 family protein [Colwellia sp. UCD-KL20]|uniref:VC2046/SO_2500 family protein n=1 Tax=Colwellia sp. UCD-KL20 TaxID=1917165 RepID=UPI00097041BB|nr:VC2046/SO_2500 family protein [Colwellia sp. UCD-KL20]
MLADKIKNEILINELQLGEQLNQCIHKKERSQFSLLLAMLTDDVKAHAQFSLPKSETVTSQTDKDNLRKQFKLPEAQLLSLKKIEQVGAYNQADLVLSNNLSKLRLLNAIKPSPLAFRDDKTFIAKNVLENTSLYCQKKYQSKNLDNDFKTAKLDFKATEWLNAINESMNSTMEKSII